MSKETKRNPIGFVVAVVVVTGLGWAALRAFGGSGDVKDEGTGAPSATTASGGPTASTSSASSTSGATASGGNDPSPTTDPTPNATGSAALGDPAAAGDGGVTLGKEGNIATALLEMKKLQVARAALDANDPKRALEEIEAYEKIPGAYAMKGEATTLKIEALAKSGRKTDAVALAMSARDNPEMAAQLPKIEALRDAGVL
jgi:hypothetical protein